MKALTLIISLFITIISLNAQGIEFDHSSSWKELKEKAKASNKLIFVDAFTTWCGPCKMMAKNTFMEPTVADYFNSNFVNAKIDMEKGEGLEIAKMYSVRAYPTFLFIDGDGVLQHRSVGYQEAPAFVNVGKTANDISTRLGTLNSKYSAGQKDPEFLYMLAHVKSEAMDPETDKVVGEYFATQKDWSTDNNLEMIYEFAGDLNSPLTQYYIDNKDKFVAKYGANAVNKKTEMIIARSTSSALNTANPDFDKIKSILIKLDAKNADKNLANIQANYLLRSKKYSEYAQATINYLKKYPTEDPNELNEAAWNFYLHVDDKPALEQAAEWAVKATEIDNKYYCNDTAAALYTKLGNKSKAKKYINKAIDLAKAEGVDYKETEALLTKL